MITGALCKAGDFTAKNYKDLCRLIGESPNNHRKQWEFIYILSVLKENGLLAPGKRGLGFGCGIEPIVPALAEAGVGVTATDLPQGEGGWWETGPWTWDKFIPAVCSKKSATRITHRHVDMTDIDRDLREEEFDFVWSCGSLEHLGSINKGWEFVADSMECLKPGGIAVHTTEHDLTNGIEVLDHAPTVLYRERHFKLLSELCQGLGYQIHNHSF